MAGVGQPKGEEIETIAHRAYPTSRPHGDEQLWTVIGEEQLPNTGHYTWTIPPMTPPKVYLRLSVRDTTGNTAVAQTSQPVLIDLQAPKVTRVTAKPPKINE